jgi:hypothetical protein
MKRIVSFTVLLMTISILSIGGCSSNGGGGNGEGCPDTNTSITVCDPETGTFSLIIDNGFFPLVVGSELELEGEEDEGTFIEVMITVLDETEVVAGVTTRVVEEAEFEDGEVVEISRNFYAQADDGTVCYFGEDVDDFEDGEIVSHEGSWRAEEDGNLPGIIMPGNPEEGMVFSQEFAPGIAEDQAEILFFGETIEVPAGTFSDTLTTLDCNPLEEDSMDEKVYIRDIGLAIDEDAELVSF